MVASTTRPSQRSNQSSAAARHHKKIKQYQFLFTLSQHTITQQLGAFSGSGAKDSLLQQPVSLEEQQSIVQRFCILLPHLWAHVEGCVERPSSNEVMPTSSLSQAQVEKQEDKAKDQSEREGLTSEYLASLLLQSCDPTPCTEFSGESLAQPEMESESMNDEFKGIPPAPHWADAVSFTRDRLLRPRVGRSGRPPCTVLHLPEKWSREAQRRLWSQPASPPLPIPPAGIFDLLV